MSQTLDRVVSECGILLHNVSRLALLLGECSCDALAFRDFANARRTQLARDGVGPFIIFGYGASLGGGYFQKRLFLVIEEMVGIYSLFPSKFNEFAAVGSIRAWWKKT